MKITNNQLDQFLNDSLLNYNYEDDALRVVSLYSYEKNRSSVDISYDSNEKFEVSISIGDEEVELTEEQLDDVYKKMELAFNVQVADDREYFYNQRYESDSIDDSYYIQ